MGGRLDELLGRLLLALGVDDARAPVALGFRLARDRPHHALVDIDVLDLDVGHLDAPRVGLLVEDALDVAVQLVALGEHLVELVLAKHRAQRRLCQLTGREHEVLDLDHGSRHSGGHRELRRR